MKTAILFALKKSGKGNPNPEKKQNTSTNKTTITCKLFS